MFKADNFKSKSYIFILTILFVLFSSCTPTSQKNRDIASYNESNASSTNSYNENAISGRRKSSLNFEINEAELLNIDEERGKILFQLNDHEKAIVEIDISEIDHRSVQSYRSQLKNTTSVPKTEKMELKVNNYEMVGCDYTKGITSDCTEEKLTIDDIQKMLRNASSKEEFLQNFPKNKVSKFTFVYNSKSQQHASEALPRVIRFSADSDFFMAYSGDNSQHIELQFFDHKNKKYNYGVIDFKAQPKLNTDIKRLNCLSCHQANGRTMPGVIWTSYDRWPGVIGSFDDNISPSLNSQSSEMDQIQHREYKMLQALRASRNLAYSTLPWANGSDTYPYTTQLKRINYWFRPNAHIAVSASIRRAEIIGHKILNSDFY